MRAAAPAVAALASNTAHTTSAAAISPASSSARSADRRAATTRLARRPAMSTSFTPPDQLVMGRDFQLLLKACGAIASWGTVFFCGRDAGGSESDSGSTKPWETWVAALQRKHHKSNLHCLPAQAVHAPTPLPPPHPTPPHPTPPHHDGAPLLRGVVLVAHIHLALVRRDMDHVGQQLPVGGNLQARGEKPDGRRDSSPHCRIRPIAVPLAHFPSLHPSHPVTSTLA
jgi:hypothetical protein